MAIQSPLILNPPIPFEPVKPPVSILERERLYHPNAEAFEPIASTEETAEIAQAGLQAMWDKACEKA